VFASTPNGFQASGTAVFRDDRLAAILDPQQTAALGWLIKRGGYAPVNFTATNGEALTMRVRTRRVQITVSSPQSAVLKVMLRGGLREGPGFLLSSRPTIQMVDHRAAVAATTQLRAMLDRLQAAGSDVLGFGAIVRERDPAAVHTWATTFSHMRIRIAVKVWVVPNGRLG
jgi:hypothetical protein